MSLGLKNTLDRGFALTTIAIYFTGIAIWITASVLTAILHYQCWKTLPQGYRSTTPGKAVGFLFLPLFNFYWTFKSHVGLAGGYRKFGETNNVEIGNSKGLAIAYAASGIADILLFLIPLANCIPPLVHGILFYFYYQNIVKYAKKTIRTQSSIDDISSEQV